MIDTEKRGSYKERKKINCRPLKGINQTNKFKMKKRKWKVKKNERDYGKRKWMIREEIK